MGFLQGKKLLITGVLSNRSIAYGIPEPAIAKVLSSPLLMSANASTTVSLSLPKNSAATSALKWTSPKTIRSPT